MTAVPPHVRTLAIGALCLAACVASAAAPADDVSELRQALDALRDENRALAARLKTLEALEAQRALPPAQPTAVAAPPADPRADRSADPRTAQPLEQRVRELEFAKLVQEDAVRSIIRDSVASLGSKINDAVALSGSLGVTLGRSTDFSGARTGSVALGAADFEFEIRTNDWSRGVIRIEHVDGKDVLFSTSTGGQAGVARLTLDTAFIEIGNVTRFPALLTAGRFVLPFGISTGHPVADVLSIISPLTVEVFETRKNAVGLSLAFPTRALGPPLPPVVAPPVQPQLVAPLVAQLSGRLGYRPLPTRIKPLAPVSFAIEPPPFTAGVYLFDASTRGGLRKHLGGHLGYQTQGHCGRRYEDLPRLGVCPWKVSVDLGHNGSIFNSHFLETEFSPWLDQIGRVPGGSVALKASLGPFALVGELNGATRRAQFTDDSGTRYAIRPQAWQVSLGYQFDWNPWVQEIGAQGTYVALGYSQSRDLGGVARLVSGNATRVGFVPKRRLILTAGEWLADGVRLALEYAHNRDYSPAEGGTGQTARSLFTTLTYVW